jgi:hypothetical protein
MLGRKPLRIDLLTTIDGVEFEEAWDTRVSGSIDSIPVQMICKELLIQNKKAAGRAQDLRDVAVLEKALGREDNKESSELKRDVEKKQREIRSYLSGRDKKGPFRGR